MKVSELSERSGVPIATIKYYLREDLLPPGRPTAANQAEYDGEHVRRLRLIRALVEVGALPLATVRVVLEAVDDADLPIHNTLGVAHRALAPEMRGQDDPTVASARADIDRFLEQLGWQVSPESPGQHQLAVTLSTLRQLGWHDAEARLFLPYAKAADRIASREVERSSATGGHPDRGDGAGRARDGPVRSRVLGAQEARPGATLRGSFRAQHGVNRILIRPPGSRHRRGGVGGPGTGRSLPTPGRPHEPVQSDRPGARGCRLAGCSRRAGSLRCGGRSRRAVRARATDGNQATTDRSGIEKRRPPSRI